MVPLRWREDGVTGNDLGRNVLVRLASGDCRCLGDWFATDRKAQVLRLDRVAMWFCDVDDLGCGQLANRCSAERRGFRSDLYLEPGRLDRTTDDEGDLAGLARCRVGDVHSRWRGQWIRIVDQNNIFNRNRRGMSSHQPKWTLPVLSLNCSRGRVIVRSRIWPMIGRRYDEDGWGCDDESEGSSQFALPAGDVV